MKITTTINENVCVSCGSALGWYGCVKCQAEGCSKDATMIIITEDEAGNTVSEQEVWVH